MNPKKPKNLYSIAVAALITLAGIAVFGTTLVHAVIYAPDSAGPAVPQIASNEPSASSSNSHVTPPQCLQRP